MEVFCVSDQIEVLLWKCSCCCLTTRVSAEPPVFHALKVTLTKGMPGKVTVSSQQWLASPQCIESWLLLSPNLSLKSQLTHLGVARKTEKQRDTSSDQLLGALWNGSLRKGAVLSQRAHVLNAFALRSLLLLSFRKLVLALGAIPPASLKKKKKQMNPVSKPEGPVWDTLEAPCAAAEALWGLLLLQGLAACCRPRNPLGHQCRRSSPVQRSNLPRRRRQRPLPRLAPVWAERTALVALATQLPAALVGTCLWWQVSAARAQDEERLAAELAASTDPPASRSTAASEPLPQRPSSSLGWRPGPGLFGKPTKLVLEPLTHDTRKCNFKSGLSP